MSKVDEGMRVTGRGELGQVVGVQSAVQEQEIWAIASLRGHAGERFEPLEHPRARRVAAGQAVPCACKRLSPSRGLGSVCSGVQAVRAELDARPVDAL